MSISIPEGAIVLGEITIVSYLDEEGKEMWAVGLSGGDMMQSQIIGLLELAKNGFLTGQ
jgi:hypothetical protein